MRSDPKILIPYLEKKMDSFIDEYVYVPKGSCFENSSFIYINKEKSMKIENYLLNAKISNIEYKNQKSSINIYENKEFKEAEIINIYNTPISLY